MTRLDDKHPCLDRTCTSTCHDIVDTRRGKAKIECFVCGTGQWVALPESAAPGDSAFRMPPGARFSGLTLDDVAAEPTGLDYIRWRAKAKNCAACQSYLDASASPA
jgi:hypothetical protein